MNAQTTPRPFIPTPDLFAPTNASRLGFDDERLNRIRGWMQAWVDSGRLPFMQVLILRKGQSAFYHHYGQADVERKQPVANDTIARYYSMTKPLTTCAAMMLYERGKFQLDDAIAKFLPEFANMRVYTGPKGPGGARIQFTPGKEIIAPPLSLDSVPTVAAERHITFRDLMTHTAGLTYGFMAATPVDALYRANGIDFQTNKRNLAETVKALAGMPLMCQPGSQWNYSVAIDVLGRLIEVIAGEPFEQFLQREILDPLGMVDTAFRIPPERSKRFAANYAPKDGGLVQIDDPQNSIFARDTTCPSGGGGLTSCVADYARFLQFILNKGVANGKVLLGRKTIELMMMNHLNGDMAAMGQPRFSESNFHGIGFGLGFSVTLDPAKAEISGSPGEVAWGGAASTAFWIDPIEDMAVMLITQLTPSSTYPIRRELRVLSYSALV